MGVTIAPIIIIGKLTLSEMIIHLSFKCSIYKCLKHIGKDPPITYNRIPLVKTIHYFSSLGFIRHQIFYARSLVSFSSFHVSKLLLF